MPPRDTNVRVILEICSKRHCRGRVTDSGPMTAEWGLGAPAASSSDCQGRDGAIAGGSVIFLRKKKEFTSVHRQKTVVIPVNVLASYKYSEVTLLQVPPRLWERFCSDSIPLVNWWYHIQPQLDKFDQTSLTHIKRCALYNIVNYT